MALSDLKAQYEAGWFEDYEDQKAGSHPRETVIVTLTRSLSYFEDPNFRIRRKGKKGSASTDAIPYACFKQRLDGRFRVWVAYARQRLDLGGYDCLVVSRDRVAEVHRKLINEVRDGALDGQIENLAKNFTQTLTKGSKQVAA